MCSSLPCARCVVGAGLPPQVLMHARPTEVLCLPPNVASQVPRFGGADWRAGMPREVAVKRVRQAGCWRQAGCRSYGLDNRTHLQCTVQMHNDRRAVPT